MSSAIPAVRPINPETPSSETALGPKTPQAATTSAAPQDKVTISDSAKQALANNSKPSGGSS
jgi:hypothetical protein